VKFSLTLSARRSMTRAEAKGCLAANLALPGAGSLAAGRAVGYFQMALAFGGMILTVLAGLPMIQWCLANWARLQDPGSDWSGTMLELLRHLCWPLAGICLFVLSIAWAGFTGWRLVSQASEDGVPPRIEP
jgi:hypothetical protein